MSDVKRLLAEATPLPWGVGEGEEPPYPHITTPSGHGLVAEIWGGEDVEHGNADAALLVYAVNHLPDHKEVVRLLDLLVDAVTRYHVHGETKAVITIGAVAEKASIVLRRLREEVPA